MSSRKRPWNLQQNDNDDDGHYDDLQDEVTAFEAQFWSPVTPFSTVESIHEESSVTGTTSRNEEE